MSAAEGNLLYCMTGNGTLKKMTPGLYLFHIPDGYKDTHWVFWLQKPFDKCRPQWRSTA